MTVLNPDGGLSNAMTFDVLADVSAYTDNFNRTNESPIRGNWVTWDFGLGRMELYNNQVRSTDTNPYNVWARRTSEPYSANHYSQIKLTSAPSGEVGGPAVRVQLNGSEINGYIFTVLNSTTAAIWVRYSSVPDTWQQVGTNFTGTFASGDVYKLEIKGNVLTVYRNGVSLGTRTDTSNRIPSGGAAGVSVVYPGTWDDWQGGGGSSDSSPPYVISQSPPSGAMGVPKSNRLLSFHVADSGTGINSSDISATIAGATYTCSSGLSCTGSPNDITVTYVNASDWTENQVVAVSINARDMTGNIMPIVSYTFSIGTWALAWSDEFDNGSCTTLSPCAPDMTKWIYEVNDATYNDVMSHTDNNHYYKSDRGAGWGTDRLENVRVEDGTLVLETRNDNWNGHGVTSGRLRTSGGYSDVTENPWVVKKQIMYGRLEARVKMDDSPGLWAAFWTAGVGADIWSTSGEIDVFEQKPWDYVANQIGSGVWSAGEYNLSLFLGDPGFDITGYHTYAIEWKPGEIKLFYDYVLKAIVTPSNLPNYPYDTYPQDIRLWHGFNSSYGASPSTTLSTPKRITFDYVRYYTQGAIAPSVTGLSPSYATAGGPAFTLTVSGSNFVSGSKVRWNGSDRVTTFVSATELRTAILAADVATAGSAPVTVFNPDGSLSNALTFEIRGLQPAIISLSPSWGTAGGPSFTLIVDGSNFISGSKVRWKGSDRVTSFISGTELQASISAADIASAGTAGVTVYTPPPGGGTSNAINFDILAVLTALGVNPSSVLGGSLSTGTVTLSGPAPAGGAVVSLGSDNTLAANVPASVTVAGGATSATFPITTSAVSRSTAVTISAKLRWGHPDGSPDGHTGGAGSGVEFVGGEPVQRAGGESLYGYGDVERSCACRWSGGVAWQRQHVGGECSCERDGGLELDISILPSRSCSTAVPIH